jgi:hypothetical protein
LRRKESSSVDLGIARKSSRLARGGVAAAAGAGVVVRTDKITSLDRNEEQLIARSEKSEQSRGSDPRSVPEAAELGPDHVWSDTTPSCRRVEAAIGRGEHFRRVTDYRRHPFNPV